jgi:hypothetical protein
MKGNSFLDKSLEHLSSIILPYKKNAKRREILQIKVK